MELFYEIMAYVATVLIVVSMVFKTTTYVGTQIMRVVNAVGSIAFTIYGFGIGGACLPTGIANAILFIINIVFIFIEYRDHKKALKCEKD